MAQRYTHPLQQWIDKNGNPGVGWKLAFYESLTSTPLAVYADADLSTPLDNPVISDTDGGSDTAGVWPVIFMQDAVYKVILSDETDNEIWSEDPYDATLPSDGVTNVYDLVVPVLGKPTDGEVFLIYSATRSLQLPAGLTDTSIIILTHPTSTMTFTLKKNGVSIGTIAFATNGAVTITFLAAITLSAGDYLTGHNQATADATGGNVGITFVFTVL